MAVMVLHLTPLLKYYNLLANQDDLLGPLISLGEFGISLKYVNIEKQRDPFT